ncbi:MAG TPA: MBL fold metallo-hydrolase [Gemmatimonadaceae bacterium]|nr:MBL fold metallo-hydrolase [Gemmatimonadaceae bacterium]
MWIARRLWVLAAVMPTGATSVVIQTPNATIERTQVAQDIYHFRTAFDGYTRSSSVVVINERDVLVFDAHTRPSTARAVIQEIRTLTDKPVRWLVNSHWHPDHWSGNEVYAEAFPGLQIIATEETAQYMRSVAPSWVHTFAGTAARSRAALDSLRRSGMAADSLHARERTTQTTLDMIEEITRVRRTYPTLTYRDRLTLWSGAREFRLMSMTGDATGTTVLHLPGEGVLLMGDLLVHPTQWGANGYALSPWLASLRSLEALEVSAIVPGHGPVLRDKAYLRLVIELFETVTRQVHAALARGLVTPEEVEAATKLDDLRARFRAQGAAFSAALVPMAYREARDGMQSRR